MKTIFSCTLYTFFALPALIVSVLFADKVFMQIHSRDLAGLTKSILEAHLFRCFFSIWLVSSSSDQFHIHAFKESLRCFYPNLFSSLSRATFTPSFLVLIWAISCSTFFVFCTYSHLFIHLHVSSKPFPFPTACKPNSHPSWLKPNPGCLQMLESSCQSIHYLEQEVLWRYFSRVKLLLTAKLLQRC